jgi:hypothetical protein
MAARPAPSFARQAAPRFSPHVASPRFSSHNASPRFSPRIASPSRPSRFAGSRPAFSSRHAATSPRIEQLQSRSRLSRSERRELRSLRTTQRRDNAEPRNAQSTQSNRLEQLQSRGRLSRSERREMRSLQRDERRNAREQQQSRPAATTAAAPAQNQQARALRTQAVTAQQARQGRFASGLRANAAGGNRHQFAGRRAARLAARTAWQLGLLAPYVPWRGPVYWPYAYDDVFYYTFWPDAYDPGYWAYAYDDMFDGVFFPDGAPYAEYAADGPYAGPEARVTTGSAPSHVTTTPGRVTQATRDFCAEQAKGVAAWPFTQITDAVQPNEDQKGLLENLRKASSDAATRFKDACPNAVPMTPAGRLELIVARLKATDDALQTVKPALVAFYGSLSDEQKARFNEIGAALGQPRVGKAPQAEANCSAEKAGISNLAINRIEQAVRPTESQGAALDKLDQAMQKAVDTLREACPNSIPQTPVGRLDVMQKRLETMMEAANIVRPALDEFYGSLGDEQKAKLNRLGPDTAQRN